MSLTKVFLTHQLVTEMVSSDEESGHEVEERVISSDEESGHEGGHEDESDGSIVRSKPIVVGDDESDDGDNMYMAGSKNKRYPHKYADGPLFPEEEEGRYCNRDYLVLVLHQ